VVVDVIDAVFLDEQADAIVLVLVQPEPWDDAGDRILELQERLNEYLAFAFEGGLGQFPEAAGRRVVISVDCAEAPDGDNEVRFFDAVRAQLEDVGVELRVATLS